MMRLHFLALPLVAACSAAGGESGGSQSGAASAERDFAGEYVVTFVNDEPPLINIEGHEPTVTITAERIHFHSQCIYENWSYERSDESITTGPWDYGGEVVAMCARAPAPGEEAIIAAIDGADTIRFVRRGLWLSGEGGTVQLWLVAR